MTAWEQDEHQYDETDGLRFLDEFEREVNHIQHVGSTHNASTGVQEAIDTAQRDSEQREPQPLELPELKPQDRRWAWAEIDLGAIKHNMQALKRQVGLHVQIMAVVKADGYGHGAVKVAQTALANGASMLGVSNVAEGVVLREAGISAPILILAEPPQATIPLLLFHSLIPTVFTVGFALAYGEFADLHGRTAPYHLKINTGMNRIGIRYNEVGEFLHAVGFHRALELQGVFTHFATADEADQFEFNKQMDRFTQALEALHQTGNDPKIIHAANSAAAIRYKKSYFNMVRIGIALYGLHPSEVTKGYMNLEPAMSIHARITATKTVPVGEGVSYGYTYRSPGSVLIATIPLGYADGLPRELSNHLEVLARGKRFPQVGNVCMDMCMFEVNQRSSLMTPKAEVAVGDEVVLVGKQDNEQITLDDLAKRLGTINYELACRFGMRLEKVYTNGR
jgi:alanine racemase